MFQRKASAKKSLKLFFATDIHGSEICFLKFVNAGKFYGADVLVLGGDLTGKMIVPLVETGDGTFACEFLGKNMTLTSEQEVSEMEKNIRFTGFYPYRTNPREMEEISSDKKELDSLFTKLMTESVERWVSLAEERLKDTGIKMYVTGGNDDRFEIDDLLRRSASGHVIDPESDVVDIDGIHEMLSSGWSNPTPWKSPRECSEEELERRLEKLASEVKDMGSSIFNLHIPPKDSGLDTCPMLDTSISPPKPIVEFGEVKVFGAGSAAVRTLIERHQPLLGLHGHIHESKGVAKIGRTLCINPGSDYTEGILKGVLITFDKDGSIKNHQLISG